jgi:hypothetical protein
MHTSISLKCCGKTQRWQQKQLLTEKVRKTSSNMISGKIKGV